MPDDRPSAAPTGTSTPLSLSIVSNSRLLREGLSVLLATYLDFRVAGSYAASAISVPLYPVATGQVALLDGVMGRERAVVWTRRWRSLSPPAQVVVLELANDAEVILACVEAGANGYTLRGASAADVATTIQAILQGRAHCSPEITACLFARLADLGAASGSLPQPASSLTARELEVLRYVAMDYSNQEIAATLVIEMCTVKHHVHSILDKLKLRHRDEAARLAAEQGWLGTDK
jgi:two-component system nitrate/nitrite response regulator NarL